MNRNFFLPPPTRNPRRNLFALFLTLLLSLSRFAPAQSLPVNDSEISPEGLAKFEKLMVETKSRQALIIHKGKVVAEWYWLGSNADAKLECWSLSKSVASTAIGFLVDEGKIASIDDPVAKYIPSWKGTPKEKITIANLLDQTSGLKEAAGANTPANLLQQCLDTPVLHPPGEEHRYNNGACNILSAVISSAAGKDPEEYMREKMWKPLGMSHTSWRRDDGGHVLTYAGVQSTARDIAKFGELFLHDGKWDGQQILSKSWVEKATTKRSHLVIPTVGPDGDYGLLWWLDFKRPPVPHNYSALGLWGNHLTVIPDLDLIGVRLVGNNMDGSALMRMVPEWVETLAGVVKR